jgi:hypothetical protein
VNAAEANTYPASQTVAADALRDSAVAPRWLPDERPSTEQVEIYRRMTPEQRWHAAYRLYWTCRHHKAAFLQSLHPDWPEATVAAEVRRIFQNART